MAQTYNIKPQAEMMLKEKAFDYGITKPEIPQYISNNLKYNFFEWQKNAFENFLTYQVIKERENHRTNCIPARSAGGFSFLQTTKIPTPKN